MPRARIRQGQVCREVVFEGAPLLSDVLAAHGFAVPRPCGGHGTCGKCGVAAQGWLSSESDAEHRFGTRLSCQTRLVGDCEILLPETACKVQIQTGGQAGIGSLDPMGAGYGAAVDLGTTTIVLKLYALDSGRCMGGTAALNPQTDEAADVMGRIELALQGKEARLRDQAERAMASLLRAACDQAGVPVEAVDTLVVCGNTTMLYLLTGRAPRGLAAAPFEADALFGGWATLLGKKAYLPRCMHAFVGADITCAVLASGMCEQDGTCLLCDIGTNGEIALWHAGMLYVASTAAGPAFEGAGISCGMGSVSGGVDRVWVEDGRLAAHTIDDAPAVGVCGSGLLDAVAALLRLGLVDETGATDMDMLPVAPGVALLPGDIRAVQLAKAAIAAGIQVLLAEAGIEETRVERLCIAGGFGSHLNLNSAARIGLIPQALLAKTEVLGNAALAGAQMLLLDRKMVEKADALAHASRHVDLGGNPRFGEAYMENMMF